MVIVKKYFSNRFKDCIKNLIKAVQNNPHNLPKNLKYLYKAKRHTPQTINLNGTPVKIVDSASFMYMYHEIYVNEIYKFKTAEKEPVILDLGANIGLSVLYFKSIYPKAKITAFEADPLIYRVLQENTSNLTGVELVPKAVYDSIGEINFTSDGSDGGSIFQSSGGIVKVPTCLLSEYLQHKVDFLKIDIEGAELQVLKESAHLLGNVNNLFVEYHSFVKNKQSLHELLALLSEAGFRYFISDVPLSSMNPFVLITQSHNMDMQLNISCVRMGV